MCESHFPLAQHNGAIPLSVLGWLTSAIAHGPLAVCLDPALHLLLGQLLGKVALEVCGLFIGVQHCTRLISTVFGLQLLS